MRASLLLQAEANPGAAWNLLRNTDVFPPEERDFAWGVYNRWCLRQAERGDGQDRVPGQQAAPAGPQPDAFTAHSGFPSGGVMAVAFRPNSDMLVTAGQDRTLKLWTPL